MAKMSGKGPMPKGGFMTSAKGMMSFKDNPVSAPSENKPRCGPGSNSDQMKADKLLQRAQKEVDSLRGKSGM